MLMYTPFTGLGLFNGSRGGKWMKNRIHIYKQFVVPSLLAQSNQDFSIWISWRKEEKNNKDVKKLEEYLVSLIGRERVVFTYSGCCFYDDKYSDIEARERLAMSLHNAMPILMEHIGDTDSVTWAIQPSDDCYHSGMVEEIQTLFKNTDYQCIGYKHGYIMSYPTGEVREYNPETNPPFVSIKMPLSIFVDVPRHMSYTALKHDIIEE